MAFDFSLVTACGESCADCPKKRKGICPGCIEADGYVPEWADSGRCRVHACTREHGALLCGLCESFPCEKLPGMVSWNPDCIQHFNRLREQYRKQTACSVEEIPGKGELNWKKSN